MIESLSTCQRNSCDLNCNLVTSPGWDNGPRPNSRKSMASNPLKYLAARHTKFDSALSFSLSLGCSGQWEPPVTQSTWEIRRVSRSPRGGGYTAPSCDADFAHSMTAFVQRLLLRLLHKVARSSSRPALSSTVVWQACQLRRRMCPCSGLPAAPFQLHLHVRASTGDG